MSNGKVEKLKAERDELVEHIRIMQANHDRMCKDFDARNELLEKEQQAHLLTKGTLMVRTEQLAAERRIYKAARRIIRATRLTAELGHADILDALQHAEEMRSALRVIYTWAGVDGEDLDHRQVRKLAAKALRMGANAIAQGREHSERPAGAEG